MTLTEAQTIPKEASLRSPEQMGRITFEKFISFGCQRDKEFSVGYKYADQTDMQSYEAFVDNLFDNCEWQQERQLLSDDPSRLQREIYIDSVMLLETRYFNEQGIEFAVDYVGFLPSESIA